MYGQMTAGSWIYIGSQGIVQGTYETFVEMGRQHFGGKLAGKWILTAGLGGMGGAQPLAATMAGASMLAVECRPERIAKRLQTRYLDVEAATLDEALKMLEDARRRRGRSRYPSVCWAMPARFCPSCCVVGSSPTPSPTRPRRTTRSTAISPPAGPWRNGTGCASAIRSRLLREARASMARHVESMLQFQQLGIPVFDYGNNLRQVAFDEGVKDAFAFPGFVPAYIRPLFCRGVGPFRWAALSGDPGGHLPDGREGQRAAPQRRSPAQLAGHGPRAHPVPGPAGSHLLGRPRRPASPGPRFQRDGGQGRVAALRSSSVAITWTPARSPAPIARPKPCATAPMPWPTGRC